MAEDYLPKVVYRKSIRRNADDSETSPSYQIIEEGEHPLGQLDPVLNEPNAANVNDTLQLMREKGLVEYVMRQTKGWFKE